jgi:hypothetical protein
MEIENKGWIRLYRRIEDHWIYPKGREFSRYEAWLDLILNANHSDQKAILDRKNTTYMVLRGQQIRSAKTLSEKWNWSRGKVRRFLDLLKNDSMIELKSDQNTTMITICNYDQYQDNRPTNEHRTDIERTSDGHQTDTNNNDNNDNNDKNDIGESPFSGQIPKPEKIDYSEIIDTYHRNCPNLSRVVKLTKSREKHISSRVKEYGLKAVFTVLEKAGKSDFLNGKNPTNWTAGGIDWIFTNSNFLKILEGNYDNRGGNPTLEFVPRGSSPDPK